VSFHKSQYKSHAIAHDDELIAFILGKDRKRSAASLETLNIIRIGLWFQLDKRKQQTSSYEHERLQLCASAHWTNTNNKEVAMKFKVSSGVL
jgi:hypothetical protein